MHLPRLANPLIRSAAAVALVAAIGCATTGTKAPARKQRTVETLPDGSQVVCELERPTGSHIPETVCHTYSPLEVERMKSRLAVPPSAAGMRAPGG